MAQLINTPKGQVSFPDEMTQDQISAVLDKEFSAPNTDTTSQAPQEAPQAPVDDTDHYVPNVSLERTTEAPTQPAAAPAQPATPAPAPETAPPKEQEANPPINPMAQAYDIPGLHTREITDQTVAQDVQNAKEHAKDILYRAPVAGGVDIANTPVAVYNTLTGSNLPGYHMPGDMSRPTTTIGKFEEAALPWALPAEKAVAPIAEAIPIISKIPGLTRTAETAIPTAVNTTQENEQKGNAVPSQDDFLSNLALNRAIGVVADAGASGTKAVGEGLQRKSGMQALSEDINTAKDLKANAENSTNAFKAFNDRVNKMNPAEMTEDQQEVLGHQWNVLNQAKNDAVNEHNAFLQQKGMTKRFSDNNPDIDTETGLHRNITDSMAGRFNTDIDLNKAGGNYGMRTPLKSIDENEQAFIQQYGITPPMYEKMYAPLQKTLGQDWMENLGLAKDDLSTLRKSSINDVLDANHENLRVKARNAQTLADEVAAHPSPNKNNVDASQAVANARNDLVKISDTLRSGNHRTATDLINDFKTKYTPMRKQFSNISKQTDNDLFDHWQSLKEVNNRLADANKGATRESMRGLQRGISRIVRLGAAPFVGHMAGGLTGAAIGTGIDIGAALGKKALSSRLSKSAASGLEDLGNALEGGYTAPFYANTNAAIGRGLEAVAPVVGRGIQGGIAANNTSEAHKPYDPLPDWEGNPMDGTTSNVSVVPEPPATANITPPVPATPLFPKNITDLYYAIAHAETGGQSNRWIRTKVRPEQNNGQTSTAWGPVQITGRLAKDLLLNHGNKFTSQEKKYLKAYIAQAQKFSNADPNDPVYGYGGTGELTSDSAKRAYSRIARKGIQILLEKHKGDTLGALREWRGGDHPDEAWEHRVALALPH